MTPISPKYSEDANDSDPAVNDEPVKE